MSVARTERCRVAVDRSSARKVSNKVARRFGLDRGVDFERGELGTFVWVAPPHHGALRLRRVLVQRVVLRSLRHETSLVMLVKTTIQLLV
eukprot:5488321-Prymnesium_polylepis.1